MLWICGDFKHALEFPELPPTPPPDVAGLGDLLLRLAHGEGCSLATGWGRRHRTTCVLLSHLRCRGSVPTGEGLTGHAHEDRDGQKVEQVSFGDGPLGHCWWDGNGVATAEGSLLVLRKLHRMTASSSNSTPGYTPRP